MDLGKVYTITLLSYLLTFEQDGIDLDTMGVDVTERLAIRC